MTDFIRPRGGGEQGEFDAKELTDVGIAIEVGKALNAHYPDHPWVISVQGGGLVVRHLAIAGAVAMKTGREGFASLLPRDKLGTPASIALTAVRFGGELLEAFGLPRGRWDGREPVVPEGIVKPKPRPTLHLVRP